MKKLILLLTIVFLIGFATNSLISSITDSNGSFPILKALNGFNSPKDVDSPANHITNKQIHVYDNRILLDIEEAEWSIFSDTNSMDPVLDKDSNGIEIKPKYPSKISVGDIISFRSNIVDGTIVHRVIEIGEDEKGWFARTKGDNNPSIDPEKVRFNQIEGVVVAIIY